MLLKNLTSITKLKTISEVSSLEIAKLSKMLEIEKSKLTKRKAQKTLLTNQLEQKRQRLKQLENDGFETTLTRDLLDFSSQKARESGCQILEDAVTEIIQIVFGDNYQIKLKLDNKGGAPVADVYVIKRIGLSTEEISLSNEGGGLKDVISLAFFVTISKLIGTNNASLVVMDEPTSAVSKTHAESVAEAIALLTKYLEKPSLIITHEREFLPNLIENVYYVEQGVDGVTKIEEL